MVSYFDLELKFHHLQVKLVIKQPSLDTYRRDLWTFVSLIVLLSIH